VEELSVMAPVPASRVKPAGVALNVPDVVLVPNTGATPPLALRQYAGAEYANVATGAAVMVS
jgi:hypothetical protein